MNDRFREFYEAIGEKYPEDRAVYRTLSGLVRKKWIQQRLQSFPRGNLLDCGCNIGTLSREWHRGAVFGTDISFAVLSRGMKNAPGTCFIQADLRDFTMLRQGSIDNAMVCEVIEHLDKPGQFLKHLYPAVKKGGHVLITSPNYSQAKPSLVPLGVIRSYGVTRGTSGTEYLHTAYQPDELGNMAREAGFTILEQGSFEHELRGWLKPLTIVEKVFDSLSMRYFSASRLNQSFERFKNRMEINAFEILETFCLSWFLKRIFAQGRRSYIVAIK